MKTLYKKLNNNEEKIKIRKIIHKDKHSINVHKTINDINYYKGKIYLHYEYNEQDYVIVYNNTITYLDLKEICKENMDIFPIIINESKKNNDDIYEIIRKYGGPMGNFHTHITEPLYLADIIDIHTHESLFKKDDILTIIDDMYMEYTFDDQTPIKIIN
jgi:hypothetical protein